MIFAVAAIVSALLVPVLRWAGPRTGFVDRPTGDALKIHRRPISLLGGVAVMAGTLAAVAVDGRLRWPVLGAVAVALATGLADDRRPLGAAIRVGLLAAAGAVAAVSWAIVGSIEAPGVVVVVALVLACANGVNIVDGQDGLAGGMAAIAAVGLGLAAVAAGGRASLAMALAGGLVGFLLWNRPPARIFLGNGGAYAVGTILAVLAVGVIADDGLRGAIAAGLCLYPFAYEIAFTVVRRLATRSALAGGDRQHTYDLLAAVLGTRLRSTLACWAVAALAVGSAQIVARTPLWAGALVAAVVIATSALAGLALWSRRPEAEHAGEPAAHGPTEAAAARGAGPEATGPIVPGGIEHPRSAPATR